MTFDSSAEAPDQPAVTFVAFAASFDQSAETRVMPAVVRDVLAEPSEPLETVFAMVATTAAAVALYMDFLAAKIAFSSAHLAPILLNLAFNAINFAEFGTYFVLLQVNEQDDLKRLVVY